MEKVNMSIKLIFALLILTVVLISGCLNSNVPIQKTVSTSAPTASIVVANNPDTPGADMKILHKGGDTLKSGEWKLSIVAVGQRPLFKVSNSDLSIGSQIIATTTTCDNAIITSQSVSGCSALSSQAKYDVKLVHIPSNAMLLDQIVEIDMLIGYKKVYD